ncbi:hypothetical protein PCL_01184 [Purpureocillium lilacinum]|uniref:Uncharacterized protein n=1 Tax=Purpureocillium lilacinum TaxID=33203 RepID=A0A2U3E4X3_PURLI|nr:hypothetical protein PCL_01184 [Purpureocillium lilacinum]
MHPHPSIHLPPHPHPPSKRQARTHAHTRGPADRRTPIHPSVTGYERAVPPPSQRPWESSCLGPGGLGMGAAVLPLPSARSIHPSSTSSLAFGGVGALLGPDGGGGGTGGKGKTREKKKSKRSCVTTQKPCSFKPRRLGPIKGASGPVCQKSPRRSIQPRPSGPSHLHSPGRKPRSAAPKEGVARRGRPQMLLL